MNNLTKTVIDTFPFLQGHLPVEKGSQGASFAVAWVAAKFTEPFRLVLALAVTPRVARWLRRL